MATSGDSDKHRATDYLVNPFHEPTPAEETGLGGAGAPEYGPTSPKTSSQICAQNTGSSTSTNPFRREKKPADLSTSKDGSSTKIRAVSNGSSPAASPRHDAFASFSDSARRSISSSRGPPPASSSKSTRPRRSSSLREKFPGDTSIHPLDTLTREAKLADRSPHLKKKHLPGKDSIDKLDDAAFLGGYHHEGPYDAASLARNNSYQSSPVAAVAKTNLEALRATPVENVNNSVERHRPLEGTSTVPSGVADRFGRVYQYKEGLEEDMMRYGKPEGGVYKQIPGFQYHPDDLKGKSEPSYTIEKRLKDQRHSSQPEGVELVERLRPASRRRDIDSGSDLGHGNSPFQDARGSSFGEQDPEDPTAVSTSTGASAEITPKRYAEWEKDVRGHRKSTSIDGLKRRIGSLRRKDNK